MGKQKKVAIIRLTSEGHVAMTASYTAAYEMIAQSLDQGHYVHLEPGNTVITSRSELHRRKIVKAIIFAPVVGG